MWRLRLMAMRNTWDSFRSRSMTAVERASDDKAMELGGHNFKSAHRRPCTGNTRALQQRAWPRP